MHAMRIGFIGLGAMGYPMAGHLARHHEVIVWNRTAEKAERHAREHGTVLATGLAYCAGAGPAIKVLTKSSMGATVWITSECLLVAKQFGIDLKTALAVTNAGSGRSNASENLLPMRLLEQKWPLVFKLAHHDKDIRIAASIAHQQHAATPMLALTQHLFSASLNELGDQADYLEVAKIVAKMNGTTWD